MKKWKEQSMITLMILIITKIFKQWLNIKE
jgi:hypothetical protein